VLKATPEFFRALNSLNADQRAAADAAFKIFRANPFDARLGAHKIHKLSARYRCTVWSVTVANDLRAVFAVEGNTVVSLDIGTHDIYK